MKLDNFPKEWISVVHCTVFGYYSDIDKTDYDYFRGIGINEDNTEWIGIRMLIDDPSESFPDQHKLMKPYMLFQLSDILIAKLHEIDSSWYIFSSPYIHNGCHSCDGVTNSSFKVTEYPSLYNLFYYGLDNNIRDELGVDIDLPQNESTLIEYLK